MKQTEPSCKKLKVELGIGMKSASNEIDLPVRNVTDLENSYKEESSHETINVGDGIAVILIVPLIKHIECHYFALHW